MNTNEPGPIISAGIAGFILGMIFVALLVPSTVEHNNLKDILGEVNAEELERATDKVIENREKVRRLLENR